MEDQQLEPFSLSISAPFLKRRGAGWCISKLPSDSCVTPILGLEPSNDYLLFVCLVEGEFPWPTCKEAER